MKIVETDNWGGDYPDEKFLDLPDLNEESAKSICNAINDCFNEYFPRFWKVVSNDYVLRPGFEP